MHDRCDAYVPRLRVGQFFSHLTAAELWGVPLPFRSQGALDVSAVPPRREPRAAGVRGHRLHVPPQEIEMLDGLPVTSAAETWASLGGILREEHLVVAGDWLVSAGLPVFSLADAVAQRRRRGAVSLRSALELVRPGAESPRETRVRVILVRAMLPEPELNWTLRGADDEFIARLDMAYPRYRVAVEYDGRQHADATQFRRDADRWRHIADADWLLVRAVAHHLAQPERDVVAPVRAALASRGWSPSDHA